MYIQRLCTIKNEGPEKVLTGPERIPLVPGRMAHSEGGLRTEKGNISKEGRKSWQGKGPAQSLESGILQVGNRQCPPSQLEQDGGGAGRAWELQLGRRAREDLLSFPCEWFRLLHPTPFGTLGPLIHMQIPSATPRRLGPKQFSSGK
jgi:hypothetical protein